VADEFIDPSRIEAAKETAHAEEGLVAVLTGAVGWVASGLAVTMSLLFMYSARATVTTQILRLVFLAFSLVLAFLLYPIRRKAGSTGASWFRLAAHRVERARHRLPAVGL